MSVVQLPDGKQIYVNGDLGTVLLQISAFKGSLGIQISPNDALEVAALLIVAARKAKKG